MTSIDEDTFTAILALHDGKAWDTRRVYADWLEDHGRTDEALTHRWMATNHKRPYPCGASGHWYPYITPPSIDEESDLPCVVFSTLVGGSEKSGYRRYFRAYRTPASAILDLTQALKKLGVVA